MLFLHSENKSVNLTPIEFYSTLYGGFGAVASSLLSGLSRYVDIGLVLTVDMDTLYLFPPASSQGPLLLF